MYKYNLLERLDKLTINDREVFWIWAPGAFLRNKETIRNWLYIKQDSSKEIGAVALQKLAIFFECLPGELFSQPLDSGEVKEGITKIHHHVYKRNDPR